MSLVNATRLRSKVLLNISDILARKIDSEFGVLLGFEDNRDLVALTSFEIVSDGVSIDYEYLYKRYNQLKLVYLQCSIIGIYHIKDGSRDPNSATIAMCQQIQQFCQSYDIQIETPFISIIYNKGIETNDLPFHAYLTKAAVLTPIVTVVDLSETEIIAASTIENNKNYYIADGKKQTDELDIRKHIEQVSKTLKTLNEKMSESTQVSISDITSKDHLSKIIEPNKNLVEISNRLNQLRKAHQDPATEIAKILKLQSTQLALLTEQKMVLEIAQSQSAKFWRPK
ncbi:hypothetical protein KGF56_003463 [Candida oxycetoniae]|uniref:JAB1/MPN/MOV34 metalloenzyme domain-containing protein n=1 Tax=Candida oxycetoniae TaxID=497107 RepID=A0AAI9SVC4_9ASCO|nr:uncharacterized protein KGF56_003463 [Candida oxycetoniae]KAI3403738.1 hypothetical protein KGF56_003463 [Candida oxycetoniae]